MSDEQKEQRQPNVRVDKDKDGTLHFIVILKCGEIEIRRFSGLLLTRYLRAWEMSNPKPEVPYREMKIAKQTIAQPDYKDEYYERLMKDWDSRRNLALTDYMYTQAIVSLPPASFDSTFAEIREEHGFSDNEKKLAWIYNLLSDPQDAEDIMNAMNQLTETNEDSVWEKMKSFPDSSKS